MNEVGIEWTTRGDGTAHVINYERYRELGGIINEADHRSALIRAGQTTHVDTHLVAQAEIIAHKAGFILDNYPDHIDPITILYGVLRSDRKPGAEYYHGQMSNQRLMVEVLRKLDCPDLIRQVKSAYFNMSFK